MADPKVRCPVCGNSIQPKEGRLVEHKDKYSTNASCYGSHMPVFVDDNIGWSAGDLIFLPQKLHR